MMYWLSLGLILLAFTVPFANCACWPLTNLKLGSHDGYIFYINSCYDGSDYYYSGNYTVRSVGDDTYYMKIGDQLCSTSPSDDTWFSSDSYKYSDENWHSRWATYSPFYSSFYPKLEVQCSNIIFSCELQVTLCLTVYLQGTNREVPIDIKTVLIQNELPPSDSKEEPKK
jgi:hypothetical protein